MRGLGHCDVIESAIFRHEQGNEGEKIGVKRGFGGLFGSKLLKRLGRIEGAFPPISSNGVFWMCTTRCTIKSKILMNDLRERLVQCFSLVFPDLKAPAVYSASAASVAGWDSTAAIILANVIEEEFHLKLDYDVVPDLVSFDLILNYLETQQKNNHAIS